MAKILIAEDNELNLKLMQDILLSQGHELYSAVDGEEAIELLEKNFYDLLLLDLQMPKISGFEVLKRINESGIKIKTIVVSACAMTSEIQKTKELGCIDFITKPIRLNEFLAKVNENLV